MAQSVGDIVTDDCKAIFDRGEFVGPARTYEIAKEAYIYGFPMIANYKAMYGFAIDRAGSQFKAPFNQIYNLQRTTTPADTAVITPNADTPYSMLELDLRAEPIVFCVPEVEKTRYYSVQIVDMYTFNFGYVGSRATGNGAGCYMVSGPAWKGEKPAGVAKIFPSETEFAFAIFRTQLLGPDDMPNVIKVQSGYKAQPLSQFLGEQAPPAAPEVQWPKFTDNAFKTDAFAFLNFLTQFTPTAPQEVALRAKIAQIGIAPGEPYDYRKLPELDKLAQGLGIKHGFEEIQSKRLNLSPRVNGWSEVVGFGDRASYNGDWLLRAADALAGIYGNDAVEALYPAAYVDGDGATLDAGKYRYTLTFPAGQYPPANAFWSVTMYDGKTQLLVANPINRYLINSPMLPELKTNADGSLTMYIQKDSPGADKEANWLPAPDGTFYLALRLYWPKPEALEGKWKPAPVVRTD
jgi:hypothetical protein